VVKLQLAFQLPFTSFQFPIFNCFFPRAAILRTLHRFSGISAPILFIAFQLPFTIFQFPIFNCFLRRAAILGTLHRFSGISAPIPFIPFILSFRVQIFFYAGYTNQQC